MEHHKCLVCDSTSLQSLDRYSKYHLVKCTECEFVFSKKIPTDLELNNYYTMNYSRQDYDSPITRKRYNELLDYFEIFRKTNNILDIGCGIGYFLEEAKKRGWNVYGTEYTEKAIEICQSKNITIDAGKFSQHNYQPEFFDVITSFEVIEHINNPFEETKNIQSVLRKGGMFYLTTPNFNSISKNILNDDWNVICYPEHLSYYTPRSLSNLMQKNGYKKFRSFTTGISLTRFKKVVFNSKQSFVSKTSDDEKIRILAEENKFVLIIKNTINFILSLFEKGDTIKAYYIRL